MLGSWLACVSVMYLLLKLGIAQSQQVERHLSDCVTPEQRQGSCVRFVDCPQVLKSIDKLDKSDAQRLLLKSYCGNDTEHVVYPAELCCPFNWITPSLNDNTANYEANCQTPQRQAGSCVQVEQCQPLANLMSPEKSRDPATRKYLHESRCGTFNVTKSFYYVKGCCPIMDYASDKANKIANHRHSSLLPEDCGVDAQTRIVGGATMDLDEYPWLALLVYKENHKLTTEGCGGSLISQRYVLTAAHCVQGNGIGKWRFLVAVRLGEYDTTSTIDCLKDTDDSLNCADKHVDVPIEQIVYRDDYDPTYKTSPNDIALLRLSGQVQFTNYIKPICLPTSFDFRKIKKGMLTAAGWGITENGRPSFVKLKVNLPLVRREDCQRVYERSNKQHAPRIVEDQVCAGGRGNQDTCRADSGGPLMQVERNDGVHRWTVVGIVSYGPGQCGLHNYPAVYTKVYSYVDWILDNMRP